MIYTIYLNPTIDKTYYVDSFDFGHTNRPFKTIVEGAGKAINVSVVLKELKQDVECLGLNCIDNGEIISSKLAKNEIVSDFINVPGSARVNTKIFDSIKKEITEINEAGVFVTEDKIDQVLIKLFSKVKTDDIVVLTGSLPIGSDASLYANIIEKLHGKGVKCALDADGDVLALGLKKHPLIIKPNLHELSKLIPVNGDSPKDVADCAIKLAKEYAEIVTVSMGKNGAIITDGKDVYYAEPVQVDVLSTVGAGDSMLAGIISHIDMGIKEALKSGTAAALASLCKEGTALMNYSDFISAKEKINIIKM